MIKFGYLKGYNSYNVPTFASATARDDFFDSITGLVEIDTYYPPYFTNVIKTDINEVPQSSPFNFVILVHNEKYYYYFIDNIRYINEEIYEVQITMDTTLTHMFDVKIKDCVITRNSINRWIKDNSNRYINRNFIRENISEGHFEVDSFNLKQANRWHIICKSTDTQALNNPTIFLQNDSRINIGYDINIFPVVEDFPINAGDTHKYFAIYDDRNDTFIYKADVTGGNTIGVEVEESDTINMYIVRNQAFDDILGARYEDEYIEISSGIGYKNARVLHLDTNIVSTETQFYTETTLKTLTLPYFKILDINFDLVNTEDIYLSVKGTTFTFNTSATRDFNIRYIPQLIDDNYIQVIYGKNKGFASFPLHQSIGTKYRCFNGLNLTNTDETYAISFYSNTGEDFITFNSVSTVEGTQIELITDAWKTYQAQNKGTLSTGLKLQYTNTLYKTATSTLSNLVSASQAEDVFKTWGKPRRNPLKVAKLEASQRRDTSLIEGGISISDGLMQAYNIKKNYEINKENLEYTPDVSKGTTSAYTEILNAYDIPFVKTLVVEDIEAVARKLELYGYKQNKQQIYTTSKTIDTIEKNRYYYNCLEMRINDYELLSFVASDVMNNFVERLSNGVRLFDMTHNNNLSDNLIYDNVELEEITNG